MKQFINKFRGVFLILGILSALTFPKVSYAYPVFAQNAYENPREATGRIVCANCHLAQIHRLHKARNAHKGNLHRDVRSGRHRRRKGGSQRRKARRQRGEEGRKGREEGLGLGLGWGLG